MSKSNITTRNPLFHISKRAPLPWYWGLIIRAIAITVALIISAVVITFLTQKNPLQVYASMISGAFGTTTRIWSLLQDIAILLCISLAVTPAFKMKFWNCGAEGQTLIGGLATIIVMMFLGNKMSTPALIIVMIIASMVAGMIWALLPGIAKALWNTNETLFTLMMNYVAIQFVAFFLKKFVKSGSGVLSPIYEFGIPVTGDNRYLLNVIIVAVLTIVVYIYLKYSKHGYEITVVGESENTAKYVGINVKKVIMRTLVVSGAICGIAGLLLVGITNRTISTTTVGGRGFTAIMVSWLAKFNPFIMIATTFLIVFLDLGANQVSTDFGISKSISDIITGIILFFIIGCEFFLQYKIMFTNHRKENK